MSSYIADYDEKRSRKSGGLQKVEDGEEKEME
jgi:hypothetical protein